MSLLKYFNELTVNGKPVDEDELEDDYTTDTSEEDEETSDEDNTNELDLSTEDDNTSEEGGEDNSDTENNDDTSDSDDDLDGDYTVQTQAEEDEDNDTSEDDTANDTGDDTTNDDNGTTDSNDDTDSATDGDGDLDLSDDDYTSQDDDETGEEQDTSTDDSNDDMSTDDSGSDDSSLEEKIKQTESEIFDTLSDSEKAIKNKELIDNFIELKSTIKLFLEKVRTITPTSENNQIINFVEINLVDLERIITDYIIDRYSARSYIENFIFYQQIILTISQLKDIIGKIKVEESKP